MLEHGRMILMEWSQEMRFEELSEGQTWCVKEKGRCGTDGGGVCVYRGG